MKNKRRDTKDSDKGGTLEIPDGWFLTYADFDAEVPTITIGSNEVGLEDRVLEIPLSMAYYLSTQFCGSQRMRELLTEAGRRQVRNNIKTALGL